MNRKLNIIYAAPNRRRERKNNMKLKKLASFALAGALTLGLLPALSSPALATGGDIDTYTIDMPSALTVTKTGWNDQTAGIKASGTLADGKKLTVTATSPTNNFNLKSGGNSVAYKLAAESEKEKSYSDATAKTTWEFSKDDLAASGGKTETVGVILEDITDKPAGTYQDTVTFTASVEDARHLYSITLTGPYSKFTLVIEFYEGDTWNDMADKYPDYIKIYSGKYLGFHTDGLIYRLDNGKKVSPTEQIDPNVNYEIQ